MIKRCPRRSVRWATIQSSLPWYQSCKGWRWKWNDKSPWHNIYCAGADRVKKKKKCLPVLWQVPPDHDQSEKEKKRQVIFAIKATLWDLDRKRTWVDDVSHYKDKGTYFYMVKWTLTARMTFDSSYAQHAHIDPVWTKNLLKTALWWLTTDHDGNAIVRSEHFLPTVSQSTLSCFMQYQQDYSCIPGYILHLCKNWTIEKGKAVSNKQWHQWFKADGDMAVHMLVQEPMAASEDRAVITWILLPP